MTEGGFMGDQEDREPGSRTVGPVANLERYLPPDWWQTLFNSTYLQTDGDIVENAANAARDIDRVLDTLALDRTDPILDLCCGQGRHALELARRGFRQVTGVDYSEFLLEQARSRAIGCGSTVPTASRQKAKVWSASRQGLVPTASILPSLTASASAMVVVRCAWFFAVRPTVARSMSVRRKATETGLRGLHNQSPHESQPCR
jgi:SAM-dependent methyltransferase